VALGSIGGRVWHDLCAVETVHQGPAVSAIAGCVQSADGETRADGRFRTVSRCWPGPASFSDSADARQPRGRRLTRERTGPSSSRTSRQASTAQWPAPMTSRYSSFPGGGRRRPIRRRTTSPSSTSPWRQGRSAAASISAGTTCFSPERDADQPEAQPCSCQGGDQ
jgi:hypothetical protein